MGDTISIIANICGILGFIMSIFAVSNVIKIKKQINNNNSTDNSINQSARGSGNTQNVTTNK